MWPWELALTHDGLEIIREDGSIYAEYACIARDNPERIIDEALVDFVRLYVTVSETAASAPSGANAPYKIVPKDGKFTVVNNAGLVKATFDDRDKALAYLRALYANVKGAASRAAKVKFTGGAKNRVPETAAANDKPYGNVAYADPGYQKDGKKRYPIDTADHVRAAWSYISQAANAGQYSRQQAQAIKARIKAAAAKFKITIATS
jgi:hypothetical protein